ncbi:MAG: sensor histidine kinase [Pseudomonadota bacterium]
MARFSKTLHLNCMADERLRRTTMTSDPKFLLRASFLLRVLATMVLAWCSLCSTAAAQETLILKQQDDFYQRLTPYLSHFADETRTEKIETISDAQSEFAPVVTPYPDFGLGTARHWLQVSVVSDEPTAALWRLDFDRQYMQEMDAWIVRRNGAIEKIFHLDDRQPFSARKIENRLLSADFILAANENAELFVAYRTTIVSFLPLGIGTVDAVNRMHTAEYMVDMLFHGALLATLTIALLMVPIIGWRLGVFFALYVAAGMLYVLHADGYTFQYLWPDDPQWSDPANLSFMLLMGVFSLLFARALFPIGKELPRFNRLVLACAVIAGTLALTSPVYVRVQTLQIIAYSFVPIGSFMQLLIGFVVVRQRYVGSIAYLLGAIGITGSFSYATIAHLQPGYYNLDTTLDFGHAMILFDSLCFAAAIMLRMLAVRDERDKALRKELVETGRRVQSEAALRQSQTDYANASRLAQANRTRLQEVSHDLRAPLVALRQSLENLPDKASEDRQRLIASIEYLGLISEADLNIDPNAAHHEHKSNQNVEIFDIRIIVDNVWEIHADAAQKVGMRYENRVAATAVVFDPLALMRIVSNAVYNAIKHAETTRILVATRQRNDHVLLEIWDNGKGMNAEEVIRYTQRGQKGSSSKGSGFGLAIATELAKMNGTELEICSKPAIGTRLRIAIPKDRPMK